MPPDEPFEGETHYRRTFRWVYQLKTDNFKPEEVVFRSELRFDDTTCYKIHFLKYKVEPRKDYNPQNVYVTPDEPFVVQTHYRTVSGGNQMRNVYH